MFPERLKIIRKERSLTRAQLASTLGVGSATITRWELGTREPKYKMLVKICDALDVTSDILLGRVPHCTFPSVRTEAASSAGQDTTDEDV